MFIPGTTDTNKTTEIYCARKHDNANLIYSKEVIYIYNPSIKKLGKVMTMQLAGKIKDYPPHQFNPKMGGDGIDHLKIVYTLLGTSRRCKPYIDNISIKSFEECKSNNKLVFKIQNLYT